jgi:hypothetical protein
MDDTHLCPLLQKVKARVVLPDCRSLTILVKRLERVVSVGHGEDEIRNLHLRPALLLLIRRVNRPLPYHLCESDTFLPRLTWSDPAPRVKAVVNFLSQCRRLDDILISSLRVHGLLLLLQEIEIDSLDTLLERPCDGLPQLFSESLDHDLLHGFRDLFLAGLGRLLLQLIIDVVVAIEDLEPGEVKASIILLDLHEDLSNDLSL